METLPDRTLILTVNFKNILCKELSGLKKYCNKKYIIQSTFTFNNRILYILEDFDGDRIPYGWHKDELIPLSLDKDGNPEPIDNIYRHFCYWCGSENEIIVAIQKIITYCSKCGR